MPLVPLTQVLGEAVKGGYGVGAFNCNNMEQVQSIMKAAQECKSPVILQASRGALTYQHGLPQASCAIAVEEHPEIPVVHT